MACLDPTLDLVFKLLFTREPALLCDMLEGILAQPVPALTILDPDIPGERVGDRRIVFDIRAVLPSGARVDLEMQRRAPAILESRLVYYTARHHGGQLRRGDPYHLLTPSTGIAWLVEPLFPELPRLHSIFELRERHTGTRFSDQLAIHLLQLPYLSRSRSSGYTAIVERWARFFAARTDAERHQLALEHPIMTLANQTLDAISQDPDVHRLALEREDELEFFYQLELAAQRAKAHAKGRAEGKAEGKAELLLSQLSLRFGPPSRAARARIAAASPEQLDAWARRVLTAQTLDEVLAR